MVKIGHASLDENSKARGGKAGDQTGNEVCTRNWYNKSWLCVIRPKDENVAEKIAKAMEQACSNDNIGYDQDQRTTLYYKAKEQNWDISKVTTACECDCSSLVAVCVNAAGYAVSKDIWTGNEKEALMATGGFETLTASKYITGSTYLKRGDILLSSGHTAVVLSNGSKAETTVATTTPTETKPSATTTEVVKLDPARCFNNGVAGMYKVTASMLNVRSGAGTSKQILTSIANGTKVQNFGFYTVIDGVKWLFIQFVQNGKTITGFASSEYLKK